MTIISYKRLFLVNSLEINGFLTQVIIVLLFVFCFQLQYHIFLCQALRTESILEDRRETEKGYREKMSRLREKYECIGEKQDAEKKYILDLNKNFRPRHKTTSQRGGIHAFFTRYKQPNHSRINSNIFFIASSPHRL